MKSISLSKTISIIVAVIMAATVFTIPFSQENNVYANSIPKAVSYKNSIKTSSTIMSGSKLTFTAAGDRQTAVGSVEGETKYIPYKWELDGKRAEYEGYFSYGNYTKSIKISKPGKYELDIEYRCYQFKNSQWVRLDDDYEDDKEAIIRVKGKIKFNVNKGKKISKKSKIVTPGKKYGKLPKVKRSGYKFKGWYTKKKGGSKVTSGKTVSLSKGTTTLYARWDKKGKSYRTKNGYIGAAKAKKIALNRTGGGKVVKCHFDIDDGVREYEVEIIKGSWEYDIDVHAKTGKIIGYDRDSIYDD